MRRLALGAACAALALVVVSPATSGARETVDTGIIIEDVESAPVGFYVVGFLDTKKKCQSDRKVKAIADTGDEVIVADTDRSSDNGTWAVNVQTMAESVKIKVKPRKLGNGDKCGGATEPVAP